MIAGDEAVRTQALDPGGSFIVQAPAGSGKTELLIQRFLRLLAGVSEPEQIVAITFTRKAASEMRERVVEALRAAGAGRKPAGAAEGARLALAADALARDRALGWEIVDHPSRLQVQTIDALCLALTRRLPALSGFAAPAGVIDDPAAAYQQAAVDTIRALGASNLEWRAALRRFLLHVDNDMTRARGLIAAMLASREQWLRHIGAGTVPREALESAWRQLADGCLERADALFPVELREDLAACADTAAQVPEAALAGPGRTWDPGAGFPAPEAGQLPRWRFLAELLLVRSQPRWRKRVDKRQGFPPGSAVKETMQALLAALEGRHDLASALDTVRELPAPALDDSQVETLEAMVTVLRLAVAQLEVVFEEAGRVDFTEVSQRASSALGGMQAPTELALRLDYQIQHLLVDEFQDTSASQHRLLRLLTQGWSPGDGRTVFLVGDPMQSIYRFRQAEVGIFLAVREHGLGDVPVTALTLSTNFRAAPPLVEWVNRAFQSCFPGSADPRTGAVPYTPCEAAGEADGEAGVALHPFVDSPDGAWARRLADLAREALGRSSEVAILVRARSHLARIMPALQARGVRFTGMDITALVEQPAVRDLYSLTRALLHPADRLAWLSVLRAPWCGLTLADLLVLAESGDAPVWAAICDRPLQERLSADGRARVVRLRRALTEPMNRRGRLTLRQWVQRTWVALGGPAVMREAERRHVLAYLDLLSRHQSGMHLADEAAFRQALDGQWAHAEPHPGAVQVMTVHRAKGLEFDEVFLPCLERDTPADDKRLLLWEEAVTDDGLLLAALSARGEDEDPHYRFLRRLQAEKAEREDDRLLYVACTRARRRLHLLASVATREDGTPAAPQKGSLLRRVWPLFAPVCGGGGTAPAPPPPGGRAPHLLRRLPADWQAPACPPPLPAVPAPPAVEAQVEFSWAGETARQVGILVHQLMQRIAREGLASWRDRRVPAMLPAWREQLAHLGVPPGEVAEAAARTGRAVANVLDDERAAWLLSGDHADARNEHAVDLVVQGRVRRLRMDRTFVDAAGVRWIVDYKTGAHEGGSAEAFLDEEVRRYRAPMALYAEAFRRMGAGEIRLGLYYPVLRGWREWRFDE